MSQCQGLRKENGELQAKIKRYMRLIEEQKTRIEQLEKNVNQSEDLNEVSITRKLNHTDFDISETLDLGSAINKSAEGERFV